ncbi:hypothetical protein KR093_009886, partial [Drosophila rubida]
EMTFINQTAKNDSYEPDLRMEGTYICRMPQPPAPSKPGDSWHGHLKPHERLFYHQTMSSVRYSKRFRGNVNIPKDSLDLQLQSRYDHGRETFPDKIDVLMQRDTCPAMMSWSAPHGQREVGAVSKLNLFRVLRNTRVVRVKMEDALGHPLSIGTRHKTHQTISKDCDLLYFPLCPLAGGIKEKIHPSSVKLICSGVHTQLVNNGFSRQTSDGNFFRY